MMPRSHEPHGRLSNQPVRVADDLPSIVRALGGDPALIEGMAAKKVTAKHIPVTEY